jgi:hypothetical protein
MNKLRDDTQEVWDAIQYDKALAGFVLIGGSALTLHLGHRVSEDLDLAYTGDNLPKLRIKQALENLSAKGFSVERVFNQAVEDEFIDSGLDASDVMQDYLVSETVKLQLVRLGSDASEMINSTPDQPLRVASLDEIFALKALVCSERSKTRDWFDVFTLMNEHNYTFEDFRNVYVESAKRGLNARMGGYDNAKSRMCRGVPHDLDEGYSSLLNNAPSLAEMRRFFSDGFDRLEQDLAKRRFEEGPTDASKIATPTPSAPRRSPR